MSEFRNFEFPEYSTSKQIHTKRRSTHIQKIRCRRALPSIEEMSLILQSMNVRHVLQPFKCYPRDVGFFPQDSNTDEVENTEDANEDITYPPRARGRILVDMQQAEERLINQQQQQQKLLCMGMDIHDEEQERSRNMQFSKHALLEEIAKQISLISERDQRVQEVKKRNK